MDNKLDFEEQVDFEPIDFEEKTVQPTDPNRGQRSLVGNIFERPQKAITSGIYSSATGGGFLPGYTKGAMYPEETPSFEQTGKTISDIFGLVSPELKQKGVGGVTPLEMAGQGLDFATNPAQLLLSMLGVKSPTTKIGQKAVGKIGAMEFGKTIATTSADEFVMKQAGNLYKNADDVVKTMNNEMKNVYEVIGDNPVSGEEIGNVIGDLFGNVKKETQGELAKISQEIGTVLGNDTSFTVANAKKIKDVIQNYIPESAWLKGKRGMDLSPTQQKLVDSWFKLRDIIHTSLGSEDGQLLKYYEDKATQYYRTANTTKKMLVDTTGSPRKTGELISAFTKGEEKAGLRDMLGDLAQMNTEVNDVINGMKGFAKRKAFVGLLKKIGAGAAIAGGIKLLTRP